MRAALGEGGFVEVDANPNPLRDEVVRRSTSWMARSRCLKPRESGLSLTLR